MIKNKREVLVLLLLILLTYIPNFNTPYLWDSNEPFYVETPREMILNSTYIISTFDFTFRLNKPPLTYWLIIAFNKLTGNIQLSERILILIFFFSILLLSYKLSLFFIEDEKLSLLIPLTLAFTPRFFFLAHKDLINILLTFFIISSLYYFYKFFITSRRKYLSFFYLSLSLGFLTKGPVAVILPILSITTFLIISKNKKFLLNLLKIELLLFFPLIIFFYLKLYSITGIFFIKKFFIGENFLRYTYKNFGPHRNFLYYLKVFLIDFLPWSLFFIYSTILIVKKRTKETLFPLICVFIPILFFTFSKNKQEYYIISSYPFASIVLVKELTKKVTIPPFLKNISILLTTTIVLFFFFLSYILISEKTIYFILLYIFITFLFLALTEKNKFRFYHLIILLIPFYLVFQNFIFVNLNRFKPTKEISEKISKCINSHNSPEILNIGRTFPSLVFYLKKRVIFLNEADYPFFKRYLNGKRKCISIVNEKIFKKLKREKIKFYLIEKYRMMETKGKLILKSLLLKKRKYKYIYLISNFKCM